MDDVFLDTNIILRLIQGESEFPTLATESVNILRNNGITLCLAPQVLYEYWCSVTRPLDANGFGWYPYFAYNNVIKLLSVFAILPEKPSVFKQWLALVQKYAVKGKRTHDARLVAVMLENGVDKLLTFNTGDFAAFTEIKVIHPANVVADAK